ncbi:metallophosphoesterase [Caulobacter mirabilis]|uniref:metallophosphoesterase family protein n=1 Tax=Caulobacter mirabilis TaxID=69666 RepID=UPI0026A08107
MTTVRFAHVSDIHFGGENVAAVAACRDWIADQAPDLVLITGDLTREGLQAEFQAARAWVDSLSAPVLVVPGNHDTPYFDLAKRLFAPWRRYERYFGPVPEEADQLDGLAIARINTARGVQLRANWSKGAISARQAGAAVRALAAAPEGALRVAACHHPLIEMVGAPMSGKVHGGRAAAAVFARGGVDLVLTGHVHAPFVLPFSGGDGRTWAVGAGTLSVRERGVPAGFNCIEAEADGVTCTALTWTGSRFEPWRTWRLDRRVG